MNVYEDDLATIAPIRKPKNKRKYQCKAHRSMALKSLDRLLLLKGRLYWVEVDCNFQTLFKLLSEMASHDWSEFPGNCLFESRLLMRREVTQQALNELNHSILNWSSLLESSPRRNNGSKSLKSQRVELDCVLTRQKFLFTPRAESESKQGFVLDQHQKLEFETLFSQVQYVSPVWNPAMRNLGRIVYWFGGSDAFQRFATAMNRAPRSMDKYRKQIDRAINWTEILQKRLRLESAYSVNYDLKNNELNNDLHAWMESRNLKHSLKGKLPYRLEHARKNYVSAARLLSTKIELTLPATIAAWAICTKSGTELPQQCIDRSFEIEPPADNGLRHVAALHIGLSESSSYARFVDFMNEYSVDFTDGRRLGWILRCIEQGNQFRDIKFSLDNDLHRFSTLKLRRLRQAAERYERVFTARGKKGDYAKLIGQSMNQFPIDAVDHVARWLEMFPSQLFTRGLHERIHGVLGTLVRLAKVNPMQDEIKSALENWASRSQQIRDCFPNESVLPRELRSWLRRLTYFQRLAGDEVRIPTSLMKLLEGPRRDIRQLEYLSVLEEHGQLSDKQSLRLKGLRSRQANEKRCERKEILLTMELCVLSAIESLRKLLMNLIEDRWVEMSGERFPSDWSDQRCIEFAYWLEEMEPHKRHLFREAFAAYRKHGIHAKSNLPFNRRWIEQQKKLGFKPNFWLNSNSKEFSIGSETFTIGICHDPDQLVLMGELFGTCLSPGGCNDMSVLANIAHANKQVLYVWNSQNQIVTRKLLSVSRNNGLVGYALYQQPIELDGKDLGPEISNQVSIFCGTLSARTGWPLVDSGVPESLGHFWYDDGEVDWDQSAKDVYLGELNRVV